MDCEMATAKQLGLNQRSMSHTVTAALCLALLGMDFREPQAYIHPFIFVHLSICFGLDYSFLKISKRNMFRVQSHIRYSREVPLYMDNALWDSSEKLHTNPLPPSQLGLPHPSGPQCPRP